MPARRGYLLLVALPFLAILVALHLGTTRHPTGASSVPPAGLAAPPASSPLGLLLAQVLTVLLATRACGLAVRPLGQPQVVGEMLAGILLGPSLLGLLAPAASAALFPASSLPALSALSQLGMVLYMFVVGLDLDTGTLRERGGTALLIGHVSIAVPFALGAVLSLFLFRRMAPPGLPFAPFALFLGAAMSVTAFPVLARILAERGLQRTPLGSLALSAAALGDVTAWTILAAITVVVRTAGAESVPLATLAGLALFVGCGALVRRPMRRLLTGALEARGGITHGLLAALVALALAGGAITEALGLHALFGAFFVGLLLSKEQQLAQAVRERLEGPLIVMLVPLYFAFTGLRTRLDLIRDPEAWALAFVVVGVAVIGKLGASALAARSSGVAWRDAVALGVLMNTRGLMELVILNVGLDLGVVSPALFSILVLMAFVTTLMTNPLLSALGVSARRGRPSRGRTS
jgi:Kef-type K+ transport system membrane component KefB